jgi:hypothetical protein
LDAILGFTSSTVQSTAASSRHGGRGFYTVRIKTGIPNKDDMEVMKKIYEITSSYFKENQKSKHIIFTDDANVRACWPVCALTMREGVSAPGFDMPAGEQKIFAVQLPSFTSAESSPHYFLYKQINRDSFALKLSDQSISKIIENSHLLYEYLRSIEDHPVAYGETLPGKPEAILIDMGIDGKSKTVLQIDEIDSKKTKGNRITPTISIRLMRRNNPDSEVWYPDRSGVTMNAVNFFYFVEATLKTFLPQIHEMAKEFREIFIGNGDHFEELKDEQL